MAISLRAKSYCTKTFLGSDRDNRPFQKFLILMKSNGTVQVRRSAKSALMFD